MSVYSRALLSSMMKKKKKKKRKTRSKVTPKTLADVKGCTLISYDRKVQFLFL
ncbi:hypothetical protein P3L10_020749 [Capsicum annuum]